VDLSRALRASAALRSSALAPVLPPDRAAEIVPRLVARDVNAQEFVCRIGEPGDFFYLIDRGRWRSSARWEPHPHHGSGRELRRDRVARRDAPNRDGARHQVFHAVGAVAGGSYAMLTRNPALSDALARRSATWAGTGK